MIPALSDSNPKFVQGALGLLIALVELSPEAEAWVLGRGEPDSFAELASAQLLELPSSPLAVRAALLLQRTVRAYWYARDELEQDSLALALEEYRDEEPELLVTHVPGGALRHGSV